MSERRQQPQRDDLIEAVLREAPPRPAPSRQETGIVRAAVHSEWQAVTHGLRNRRRLVVFATAATILLVAAFSINLMRVPSALPVRVATIDKTAGSVYLLGEQSQLRASPDLSELILGQTIVTGHDSGIAVSWLGGGSLRIGEDTRIEFLSPDEVHLYSGTVYFDSRQPPAGHKTASRVTGDFSIRTDRATVSHLGTQYMTGVYGDRLTVSVREGEVRLRNDHGETTAKAGYQVSLEGTGRPSYANISPFGELWHWAERIAPAVELDGRSAHQFISWVGRETGLEIQFASDALEQAAHETTMTGTVDREPRVALRVLLQTTGFESHIENGRILIRER